MGTSYSFLTRQHGFGHIALRADGVVACFIPGFDPNPFVPSLKHIGPITDFPKEVPVEVAKTIGLLRFKRVGIDPASFRERADRIGTYYPRIWRGFYDPSNPLCTYVPVNLRDTYGASYVQSIVAAESLFQSLISMFHYVEPSESNRDSYGHRFRELLILACTEVEACWRSVLNANGRPPTQRTTTNEYVRLQDPLALAEYEVELRDYPDYGGIRPFDGWSESAPTQSLPWYNAYNAAKHDRETEFLKATLGNAISACAGLFVQLGAQWGPHIFCRYHDAVTAPFVLTSMPAWSAEDICVPSIDDNLSMSWTPIEYFNDKG